MFWLCLFLNMIRTRVVTSMTLKFKYNNCLKALGEWVSTEETSHLDVFRWAKTPSAQLLLTAMNLSMCVCTVENLMFTWCGSSGIVQEISLSHGTIMWHLLDINAGYNVKGPRMCVTETCMTVCIMHYYSQVCFTYRETSRKDWRWRN